MVEAKTVSLGVDEVTKALAQGYPLRWLNLYFKYRVLDTLPKVATRLGNFAQPFPARSRHSADIIANQDHHGFASCRLLPQERRVTVQVAAQVSSQQLRLHKGQQTDVYLFTQKAMLKLFPLALLVGDQRSFPGVVLEQHGTIIEDPEIPLIQLAPINQRKREPFAEQRTKLFGQIKRKAGSTRTIAVKKTNCGIKPNGFKGGTTVVRQ